MPHKTKRQKIASQNRRHHEAGAIQEAEIKEAPAVTVFKHDFKKSVIIITAIITLEIITYFGTMYKYLNLK